MRTPAAMALALCALLAKGAADAGSATATLRVGLTLTVSCRVDSATLTGHGTARSDPNAAVGCDANAPYGLNTSTESLGAEALRRLTDSQSASGPVRVVTLVF